MLEFYGHLFAGHPEGLIEPDQPDHLKERKITLDCCHKQVSYHDKNSIIYQWAPKVHCHHLKPRYSSIIAKDYN